MTDIITPGSLVRATERSLSSDESLNGEAAQAGSVYLVYEYVPPGEGDDPDGKPYYFLDIPEQTTGGAAWAYPEHLEVVQTAQQVAARRPPTLEQIRDHIAFEVLGSDWEGAYEINESHKSSEAGRVTFYGRTSEGLPFGVEVAVENVWETDL